MGHDQEPLSCVIFGAGGHASVVIEALRAQYPNIRLIALDPLRKNSTCMGVEVAGSEELLPKLIKDNFNFFVVGFGSVGVAQARVNTFNSAIKAGLAPLTVVHPQALVSPSARILKGAQIFAGSIVGPHSQIGENVIINHGAIIDHDCNIGAHSHVATGATLSGGITAEECVHIGAGATIKQGCRVGARSIVGAGAVVVSDVQSDCTVVGVPARLLKMNAVEVNSSERRTR